MPSDRDWTRGEVEAVVGDYFEMLRKERQNQAYVKAHHRRALLPALDNRSEGSVEMKHCNISAVLHQIGLSYIEGYKPRKNLQQMLREAVERHVRRTQLYKVAEGHGRS